MGGRGASSGTSVYGNKYGSQYRTIAKEGNIKIVEPKVDNPETLVETMTKGRVYGLINSKGNLGSILYFDNENKRTKRIDLDHSHNGIQPHTQHGYLKSTDEFALTEEKVVKTHSLLLCHPLGGFFIAKRRCEQWHSRNLQVWKMTRLRVQSGMKSRLDASLEKATHQL
jgi:hypothetical protein